MKNKKIFIVVTLIIIVLLMIIVLNKTTNQKDNANTNVNMVEFINNTYTQTDKNEIEYQENATVEDLKAQTGITASNEIFEIQQEYDGRKVLTVKPSLKYKVAFAGMIKNSLPQMNELDKIIEENLPQYTGIWAENNSRNKILQLFNSENTNSEYYIDEQGYLKISKKNTQNNNDKKIENAINSNKQYILDISSVCYIVDNITGEILDYNFEKMDKYQTYEYFQDDTRMIIFINENSNNQLSDSNIFNSIVEIF